MMRQTPGASSRQIDVNVAINLPEGSRTGPELNASVPDSRRVVFRIGINVGDVIFQEGEVYGDGVNIAARLEQIAEPGAV